MPPERWRSLPLRTRLVTAGSATMVVLFLVTGQLMLMGLDGLLRSGTVDAARIHVADLASLSADGKLPDPVAISSDAEAFVLVIDPSGGIVTSSTNLAGDPAPALPRPGRGESATSRLGSTTGLRSGTYDLVATTTAEGVTVFVAVSLDDVAETVSLTRWILVLALPGLTALTAFCLWLVVGRTLDPIEAIRREADEISGRDLHRRVPVPAGGDEVARLAATVNAMLSRLEASSVQQTRFVNDAAHELRSPLATLRTQIEAGAGDLLPDVLRLQHLTEQLLVLARTSASPPRTEPIDLDEVIDQAVRMVDSSEVNMDLRAVTPVRTDGDPALLAHVVRNLVDNAVRHCRTQVRVSCGATDGRPWLRVDDDGPGVDVSDREDIFGRFVRSQSARDRDSGGTGLGLAITHDLVRLHGGTIAVEDSDLGGARFEVRLGSQQLRIGVESHSVRTTP